MKDIDGYIFFISIYELLAIRINNENKAELQFVGNLLDIEPDDPISDVQIEKWQDLYMIVVQQSTKLKVYLVKLDLYSENQGINHIFKMTFDSVSDKFKLLKKREEGVMLVVYHTREKSFNELT